MKIVLDTNVLIAAFIAKGVCNLLFEHCIQHHTIITSDFILKEFRDHLIGKFNFSDKEVEKALQLIQTKATVVIPLEIQNSICRDPDDDNILGTALAGNVSCILTGDKDLLVIKRLFSIDIIHPSEFKEYEKTREH